MSGISFSCKYKHTHTRYEHMDDVLFAKSNHIGILFSKFRNFNGSRVFQSNHFAMLVHHGSRTTVKCIERLSYKCVSTNQEFNKLSHADKIKLNRDFRSHAAFNKTNSILYLIIENFSSYPIFETEGHSIG